MDTFKVPLPLFFEYLPSYDGTLFCIVVLIINGLGMDEKKPYFY
jgi:hypothetical protein